MAAALACSGSSTACGDVPYTDNYTLEPALSLTLPQSPANISAGR